MAKKRDHPIDSAQRRLVQRSFAKVEPTAEAVAELFYDKLFELDPGLRALFKTDLTQQGRKLMATLTSIRLEEGNEHLRFEDWQDRGFEDQAQDLAWYLRSNGPPVDPWGRQRLQHQQEDQDTR